MVENRAQILSKECKEVKFSDRLPAALERQILTLHTENANANRFSKWNFAVKASLYNKNAQQGQFIYDTACYCNI